MFQKIAKHRANDASNDVHRPPLSTGAVHKVANFTTPLFFVFDDTSFLLVRSQWDQGPKPSLLYVLYRVVR